MSQASVYMGPRALLGGTGPKSTGLVSMLRLMLSGTTLP